MKIALFTVIFVLAGCATLPPFATEESMADRATCLTAGGIWIETQRQYDCRPTYQPERT